MLKRDLLNSDKYFRIIAFASVILLFILVVIGGILRANASGGECADWATCFGFYAFPESMDTGIASIYQMLSIVVGVFLGTSSLLIWIRRGLSFDVIPFYISTALYFAQLGIGRIISIPEGELNWIPSIHLGVSLIILALMTLTIVLTFLNVGSKGPSIRLSIKSPFAKSSLLVLIILGVLLISGVAVSSTNAQAVCSSWPLCEGMIKPASLLDLINLAHRISVIITGILLLNLMRNAWKFQKSDPTILVSTTAAVVLFYSQALLASQMVDAYPIYQLVLHQSTAVAVWVSMVVLVSYLSVKPDLKAVEIEGSADLEHKRFGVFVDLISLTKPIVVILLLVTTYAGMVIGAKEFPPLTLTFWTLLGGFMAAGGSGAINQYIDRFDDTKMQRTQKRPIPAGRLTPAEGLAFGVALTLGSFFIMIAFVNLPAALLTLAGIVYYVLIYSIFLKKSTVQNIVIGGGAGAIPPLVGWAATTGGLNIPSLFLFAVVFMWTPPHFWALALVRRKDYARAGVPMLPVIRGEKETRWQILLYTIELVGLTILLPIFGLGGSIYFVGAVILGLWILASAWRLWKQGGNKRAWKMYRYSSMYLAFLFIFLMLDAVLI